jgi:hypothetical protein
VFKNNTAEKKGGAISYNMNRPIMNTNQFEYNSAEYGNNIGSYPFKIIEKSSGNNMIKLNNVPSGLLFEEKITVDIVDYDSQIVTIENSNTIKVSPITSGARATGTDFAKITNGTAVFDNLIFRYKAGSPEVMYSITSTAINLQIINQVFNGSSTNDYSTKLDIDFRN